MNMRLGARISDLRQYKLSNVKTGKPLFFLRIEKAMLMEYSKT